MRINISPTLKIRKKILQVHKKHGMELSDIHVLGSRQLLFQVRVQCTLHPVKPEMASWQFSCCPAFWYASLFPSPPRIVTWWATHSYIICARISPVLHVTCQRHCCQNDTRMYEWLAYGALVISSSSCSSCLEKYPVDDEAYVFLTDGFPHAISKIKIANDTRRFGPFQMSSCDSSCGPAIWAMDPSLPSLARQHKSCSHWSNVSNHVSPENHDKVRVYLPHKSKSNEPVGSSPSAK